MSPNTIALFKAKPFTE